VGRRCCIFAALLLLCILPRSLWATWRSHSRFRLPLEEKSRKEHFNRCDDEDQLSPPLQAGERCFEEHSESCGAETTNGLHELMLLITAGIQREDYLLLAKAFWV
jgi:hypothetical protein